MTSECRFDLNKPNAIYFSGEVIAGTITLFTTNNKTVRDVSIIFLGEGKVEWSESSSSSSSDSSSSSSSNTYTSNELYVHNTTLVHGDGVLPKGTHTYTFNIPLPWECPTSLEGKYGHVRYEISLKINRYYRFDNVFKKPVTIIKAIDLNIDPSYRIPLAVETSGNLCCWPCSRGTIFCTLQVPFGAYAPGQTVRYALLINNQSTDDTKGYRIEFKKKMIFTALSPHRKQQPTKDVLFKESHNETCLRLSNRIIEGELYIPSTPPTTPFISIICVEYKIKVTLFLSTCSKNPRIEVPIIIGTIPLRESLPSNHYVMDNNPQHIGPSAPEMLGEANGSHNGELPPSYNESKPPSFEEASGCNSHFINTDIDKSHRIVGFKPLYPMYNKPYDDK